MAVLLISSKTNHDDRPKMLDYYEVRFKFTSAPLQYLFYYGRYVIHHCSPQHRWQLYESWKYMGKNWRGTALPQVGGRLYHTLG